MKELGVLSVVWGFACDDDMMVHREVLVFVLLRVLLDVFEALLEFKKHCCTRARELSAPNVGLRFDLSSDNKTNCEEVRCGHAFRSLVCRAHARVRVCVCTFFCGFYSHTYLGRWLSRRVKRERSRSLALFLWYVLCVWSRARAPYKV